MRALWLRHVGRRPNRMRLVWCAELGAWLAVPNARTHEHATITDARA